MIHRTFVIFTLGALCLFFPATVFADEAKVSSDATLIIGLDADMSSGAALGGEAIRRGLLLGIQEINASGGVLGKQLELVVKDHRGIPARGIDNIEEFAAMENLLAVVGGVHTPVALAELESLHKHEIIYFSPWAAGTPIIDNGYKPNFAFRVSVRDEYAGAFLVKKAVQRGFQKPALFLEKTGWGRSNEKAMNTALEAQGLSSVSTEWFHWGAKDFTKLIAAASDAKSDVILLVSNAPEGKQLIADMAALPSEKRIPIISHWGITGGNFFQQARQDLDKVDLSFLQTYSFYAPRFPAKNKQFMEAYFKTFGKNNASTHAGDIKAPVGAAHAYDVIHLLAIAAKEAGSSDRNKVRSALERVNTYDGLVRRYAPPFNAARHDALDASDFRLCRYSAEGDIVPMEKVQ